MRNINIKKIPSSINFLLGTNYTISSIQPCQIKAWVNLQTKCWQETYTFMNPFYLKSLPSCYQEWATEKKQAVDDPNTYNVFLHYKQEIIGFCEAGTPRCFDYQETYCGEKNFSIIGEIRRIYILKAYQGKGLGHKLFLTAANWLKNHHYLPFRVWVFSQNTSAVAFYQKMGGIFEKNAEIDIGGQLYGITSYCFFPACIKATET